MGEVDLLVKVDMLVSRMIGAAFLSGGDPDSPKLDDVRQYREELLDLIGRDAIPDSAEDVAAFCTAWLNGQGAVSVEVQRGEIMGVVSEGGGLVVAGPPLDDLNGDFTLVRRGPG